MANIGPLDSFVFPGVYTKTLLAPPSATAAGAVRFPAIIGTGIEEERVEAFEIVRGSSATADNIIVGEDPTNNGKTPGIGYTWNTIDGLNSEFHVKWAPIVDGTGTGSFATKPEQVIVTVDGENVPVFSVDGQNGIIKTVDAPAAGTQVFINYYFKRRDAYNENEDLSVQASVSSTATFKVKNSRIVKGDNGGYAATYANIGDAVTTLINGQLVTVPVLKVLVNGISATIFDINGNEGLFTLASAVTPGATVLVSYFSNDFANTYDILPATAVSSIQRVGYDPNRADFAGNKDYVLVGNEIHWGNSAAVSSGINTAGHTIFGVNQVSINQIDNRYYKAPVGTADGATKTFTLPYLPVRGDGTGKPLYDPADGTALSYDDLKVWVGATGAPMSAAVQATVASITGSTVTLTTAPALNSTVWADLYVNRLVDDTWTMTKVSAAGTTGTYTVSGITYGSARQVTYSVAGSTGISAVAYLDQAEYSYDGVDASTSNAYVNPSRSGSDEIVSVIIPAGATGAFTVKSNVAGGTNGTGYVGQTYIDQVTGFTLSLASVTTSGGHTGILVYDVSKTFISAVGGSDVERGIPGIKFTVTDQATTGIATVVAGDTATISTFNLNDETEPNVGDLYYVTFDKEKVDYSVKYLTSFPDVLRTYGDLAQNNPIVIAANLAFLNGATSVALKQIKKVPGASDAAVSDYISAISIFDEPLTNGARPALLQVLSTDSQVIAALKASNAQQSSIRFKNERTSYFGFRTGTNPDTVMNRVRALNTEVLTAVYPDGAVITLKDSFGADQDVVVGGEYVAVALAGADVAPVRDIATPLTNVQLVGFKRLYRNLTTVVASQVANAGCTVLESRFGVTRVLLALTTDLTSVLTRDPRIVEVKNFVQQGVRSNLDSYIGQKNLPGMTGKIQATVDSYFFSLQQAEIISAYKPSKATVNAADPSTVDVTTYYSPVFPLNWIVATLNLNSTLS